MIDMVKFGHATMSCKEPIHTNFQLCSYATYPRIYEAVSNISEHLSPEDVTVQ